MATTSIPLTNNPAGMNQLGNVNSPKFARAAVLFLEFCRKKALLELIGGKKTKQGKKYRLIFKYFLDYLRLRGQQGYFFDPSANDNVNGFGDQYGFGFGPAGAQINGGGMVPPFGAGPFGPGICPFKADDSSNGDGTTDSNDDDKRRGFPGPYGAGFPGMYPGAYPGFGYPGMGLTNNIDDGDGFLAAFSNPLMGGMLSELFEDSDSESEDSGDESEEKSKSKSKDFDMFSDKDKKSRRKLALTQALMSMNGLGMNGGMRLI